MKHSIIKVLIIFSLLFSLFLSPINTSSVSADSEDLNVAGISDPSEANGTYTWLETRLDGYDCWSYTVGSTTYYIYNDIYEGGSRYWNLDTDFDDEGTGGLGGVLFFSTSSTAPSPVGLSWDADTGTGTLSVTAGAPASDIAVLGDGRAIIDGSTIVYSSNFTNLDSVSLSGGTASRIFTINNTGPATLSLSGSSPYVTISGTNASNFSVTATPDPSIAASTGTTTFEITFTPSFTGYHNAVVTINNNDPDDEGVFTFNIQGYGYVAQSVVLSGIDEPSAANGMYIHQGLLNNFQYWKHQTLNYYLYSAPDLNSGESYWNIDNDTDGVDFYFTKQSEAGTPVGLTDWIVDLTDIPLSTGSPVINTAILAPEIDVKGNSTTIAINDITPSFTDQTKFGSIDISTGSRTRTYTIENTGGVALKISSITLGGSDASEFSNTNSVLTTIPAYSDTIFTVTFDPSIEGTKTATVSIASNDTDENPFLFTISGDAFTPKNLIVSDIADPSDANGIYIYQGLLNEFQYWKHATLDYYIFNGMFDSGYYWNIDVDTDDTDNDYLFFTGSQNVSPVGIGVWSANTTPGYETVGAPIIVYGGPEMEVMGNGSSIPDGSSSPTTTNDTDFGSVSVAAGSVSHTFGIDNIGYEDLNLSGSPIVAVSGTNAADFTVTTQPTTPVPAMVGSTGFVVAFNPSAAGTRSATISIANDDSNENPYNFNIQGTGLAAPTLTTTAATTVSTTGATLGGNISNDGSDAVTDRGVVYSALNSTPIIGGADVFQNTNGSGTGSFSEAVTGMTVGTHYYYQAYAINGQGTSYGGVEEFTTLNQISSITRSGATPTNASSVSWNVEFAAAAIGLSASNFTLDNAGLTGPSITGVSGSGTSWTVTANTGTGSGTLGLNLTSAAGLNAELSNMPYTGAVYTLDRIAPTTTSFVASENPASSPTNEDTLVFRATFSKDVINVDISDFAVNGTTTAGITNVTWISDGIYDVTVSGGDLDSFDGIIGLDLAASPTIGDMLGNPLANTEPTTDETYTVDNTAPVLTSFTRQFPVGSLTNANTLTFGVSLDGAVLNVDAADFDVNSGSTAGVTLVAFVSDGIYDVIVSGGDLAEFNGNVGLNLNSGQNITDAAGNLLPNGDPSTDESYTLDNIIPSVAMSSTASDPTNTSPIAVSVTFSESVNGFVAGDITTTNATVSNFSGSGADYTFDLNPSGQGTVSADIAADAAADPTGNNNTAAAQFSRNYDSDQPTVTIEQAAGQSDPVGSSPINFTVVFTESVTDFGNEDVSLSGTAVATTAEVTGSGTTYNVAVSGMTGDGTVIADVLAGGAQDASGNTNTASTSTDNQVTFDTSRPSVVVSSTTSSPTNTSPISMTITFNESVTGFTPSVASGDIVITNGTDSNPAGSGDTYTFDLTPAGEGAVTVLVPDGSSQDAAGNLNTVSNTFSITYDSNQPTVSINPASGQSDPTGSSPINFAVVFNETVTGFSDTDVSLSGTAGATTAVVTGSGTTYNVAVSGMTGNGTVTAEVLAGSTQDTAGNLNSASNTTSITYDSLDPTVTIEQASGQSDPAGSSPINFTVVFNETVTGFGNEDVSLSGTAGATTAVVSGSGTTYNVAVSGMSSDGSVLANVLAGGAQDASGNTNTTSTSTDNQVTYDTARPSVVVSSTTSDPTNTSPISVTITFNEAVAGFTPSVASSGIIITNATDSNPAGSGDTYTFDLTPAGEGAVTVLVPDGSAQDVAGNLNTVSNTFSITYDSVAPTVTIEQAAGQADPTSTSPIHFSVIFAEPVTDFATGDVTLSGTAGATTATVTGSGTTYNVAVSGMTNNGTVIAAIASGIAHDAASNPNQVSMPGDNSVDFLLGPMNVSIDQAAGQSDPTNALPVNFTVVFERPIDLATFTPADITLSGTAPGTLAAVISEIAPNNGTTFNISVDGMTAPGSVIATIQANSVQDAAGNNNNASSSTDNTVNYDASTPSISETSLKVNLAPGPSSITVKFSEAVYDVLLDDSGTDDVTNPANYLLIEKGINGVSERVTCSVTPPASSDDVYIVVDQVIYDSATFTSTVEVNGGVALPLGSYVLYVCGTTSIVDLAGNPINNGLSDYTYDFNVITAGAGTNVIPATGFAPDQISDLPIQPQWKTYSSTNMRLEIPALGIQQPIVGVPEAQGWDVTWLGDQIGYLGGTAFPTWAGNSVLTGHATNANGAKGPFADLESLGWGDRIVIHAFGQEYIYEVRSVNRWTNPKDTRAITKHEDLPWVTLITCKGFDEKTGTYRWRTVVRAVQVSVVEED